MEKQVKPENLFVRRNRGITALCAFVFLGIGITLAVVFPLAVIRHPPEENIFVTLTVGMSLIIAFCLYLGVLNARNLFFPYLLTADEKGIYNYSGYFHFGFIKWEDIASFGKDPTILDVLDNETPSIRIYVRDFAAYKKTLSFIKKWQLFWSGSNIKIYTICSRIKRKQLIALLDDMLKYYGAHEVAQENNEQQ